MYRIRHALYVHGRGWKALERPDGREIDQFDNSDAVYLLGLDKAGSVTSGLRLMPTTKPHLMRDVFPHLVTKAERVPQDNRIYEWTRYFLRLQAGDRDERRAHSGEILCAMFEYALARRLTHISVVSDTFFLPMMHEAGWNVRQLGDPTPYPEGVCIALLIEISERALQSTRETRGVDRPSLCYAITPPPYEWQRESRAA
jgi:acyl-homoserine lactone synthase